MESRQILITVLFAVGAAVAGVSLGLARKHVSDGRATVPTTSELTFLSPLLTRGAIYGDTFVGDVPPAVWKTMGPTDRAEAAAYLSVRLIDTDRIPSAVIFAGDEPVILISQTNPRLIDD